MPEGIGSGKQNTSTAIVRPPCDQRIFRKAEWSAKGAGTCYNVAMTKQRKAGAKGTKVGGFVVGRARFGKISAVEGIEPTEAMESGLPKLAGKA